MGRLGKASLEKQNLNLTLKNRYEVGENGGKEQVALEALGIAWSNALWQGRAHRIQGLKKMPGPLKTKEEQSMVCLMKQEGYEVTRLSYALSSLLRSFCFILKANGTPLKSNSPSPPYDSTIISAATVCI